MPGSCLYISVRVVYGPISAIPTASPSSGPAGVDVCSLSDMPTSVSHSLVHSFEKPVFRPCLRWQCAEPWVSRNRQGCCCLGKDGHPLETQRAESILAAGPTWPVLEDEVSDKKEQGLA